MQLTIFDRSIDWFANPRLNTFPGRPLLRMGYIAASSLKLELLVLMHSNIYHTSLSWGREAEI